jgi:hypothetical protein
MSIVAVKHRPGHQPDRPDRLHVDRSFTRLEASRIGRRQPHHPAARPDKHHRYRRADQALVRAPELLRETMRAPAM